MKIHLSGMILCLILLLWSCEPSIPIKPDDAFQDLRSEWVKDGRVELMEAEWSLDSVNGKWQLSVVTTVDSATQAIREWALQYSEVDLIDITSLPANDLPYDWAIIQLSAANIRSAARHSAELVTQAIMGTPASVLQKEGDWYRIQTPDRYIGWVDPAALAFKSEEEMEEWRKADRAMFMEFSGRARAVPKPNAPLVRDLVMGAIVVATGQIQRGYKEILLPDGQTAWLGAEQIEGLDELVKKMNEVQATDLEWAGKDLMGVPYLWGGTSSKGVDCSGFTKTLYWMNGWILPRDASQQVYVGKEVSLTDSLEQLEPGDLLYFGRYREDGSERVTHVALHIGNRKILHSSGEVKIESLNPSDSLFNAYRYNSILSARRILGQGTQFNIQTLQSHPWYYTTDLLQ